MEEPGKKYKVSFYSTIPGTEKEVTLAGVTGSSVSANSKMAVGQIDGKLRADAVDFGSN